VAGLSVWLACVLAVTSPDAAHSAAPYDFDGDGRQELVVGLPEIAEKPDRLAGSILVMEGSSTGLDVAGRRLVSPSRDGLPGGSGYADRFGSSLASGDFNADGYADLAVGSDEWEEDFLGAVTVMYGTVDGLTAVGSNKFAGVPQVVVEDGEPYTVSHWFGSALAAGDVNLDGADDLVVGAAGESPQAGDWGSGAVHILFGGPGGLTRAGEQVLSRPDGADAYFGSELALGDINQDGNLDLVEAAPGIGNGFEEGDEAGHLSYCPGAAGGPKSCRAVGKRESSGAGHTSGSREAPASLAVGDITGDGYPDVVEGVPEDRYWSYSSHAPAGTILIRRGTKHGPAKRPQRVDQATLGVPGTSERSDRFGAAVAVGHLDRDRFADIVIGAPGENGRYPRNRRASRSGRVTVLHGAPAGVRPRGAASYDRRTPGLQGKTGLDFGTALALLDHDGTGRLDLSVGSGGQPNDDGDLAGGALVTMLGRRRGFDARHAIGVDWTSLGVGLRTSTGLGTVLGR
jgi:hypothetical protein